MTAADAGSDADGITARRRRSACILISMPAGAFADVHDRRVVALVSLGIARSPVPRLRQRNGAYGWSIARDIGESVHVGPGKVRFRRMLEGAPAAAP